MNELIEEETSGRLLATGGLSPSDTGTRVSRNGEKVTITDGPFTEAKELVSGFGISRSRRAPRRSARRSGSWSAWVVGETELRPMFGPSDATCMDKN